ncbi:ensconsin-like isoform X4 [Physella acuta]|uniref:ensconsin-like isoform X4 n=1 Tax=Physella acuta TaxID=109671 RepID=UPI0027DB18BB|nr:ensconsin-like isoform X4 [Physella acuta]
MSCFLAHLLRMKGRVSDNDTSTGKHASSESSKNSKVSDTPLASSLSKRVKMDGDGDGAPSSSSEASPRHLKGDDGGGDGNRTISFDSSAESTPRRTAPKRSSAPSTPQTQDLSVVDMKTSWDGSVSGGSAKGETTDAGMLADPVKIAKEREKEERVRQARERLMEERRKKLEELKEQQRIAQENREKQLEMRRKKIEDLRRRDSERRAAVEERRKMKEDIERARRESILQKAEERVARYEAWKAGGRKGGRGHILGFGSATPRDICQPFERPRRSSSHSALQRRSPNGSDMDSMRPQRRALSACSAVRRHCCVDYNRIGPHTSATAIVAGFQHNRAAASTSATLTRTSMTSSMPSPVRMRENKPSRKQRPASVASSMPSFVGGEPAKSPRSKSTDRTGRGTVVGPASDRSKTRPPKKEDKALKDKENEKSKKLKDEEERDADKDGDKDVSDKKDKKSRVSLSFFDRLATPKYSKKDDHSPKEMPAKKESPHIRVQFAGDEDGEQDGMVGPDVLSPRKAFSTPNLAGVKKRASMKGDKHPPEKEATAKTKEPHRVTPSSSHTAPAAPPSAGRAVSPGRKPGEKSGTSTPRVTPPPSATSTPTHAPSIPPASAPSSATTTPSQAPPPAASTEDGAPRNAPVQDITAEEYKARLAEKRRQAREKAEKEAEEERKRQEEAWLAEQERQRKEEEEQKRQEEESLRQAAEARQAEEERLQRAIEAEEKRRREEAERLEQERKAKEESERKAKEEAEKLEKEKQEKSKREEEERQARKKKLEMIMKRVKPESHTEPSLKSPTVSSSPNISHGNSSQNSPDEDEKPVVESPSEGDFGPAPPVGSAVEIPNAAMTTSFFLDTDEDTSSTSTLMTSSFIRSASSGDILDGSHSEDHDKRLSSSTGTTPSKQEDKPISTEATEPKSKFKSPLLQQLVEKKGGDSPTGTTKFKSPLLQNLLGKTKVGARMGMSSSMGDLTHNKEPASGGESLMTTSVIVTDSSSFNKENFSHGREDEDKDEDTSLDGLSRSFHSTHINGMGKDSGDVTYSMSTSKSSSDSSPPEAISSKFPNMSDSALGSSIEPHMEGEFSAPGMMSQSFIMNGHGDHKTHSMDDSSISLHSVDESVSHSASGFLFENVPASEGSHQMGHHNLGEVGPFEEVINLIDSKTIVGGTPLRAFEENNRRADVSEFLS